VCLLRQRTFAVARRYSLFWSLTWCLVPSGAWHLIRLLPLLFPLLPFSFNKNIEASFSPPLLNLLICYMYVHMEIYFHKVLGRSGSCRCSLKFCNRGNRASSSALVYLHYPITLVAVCSQSHFKHAQLFRDAPPPHRDLFANPLLSPPFF